MEPIGNVIKKIVKERNLGSKEDILNQVLQDPDINAFLPVSYTHLDVYKRQLFSPRMWR